MRYSFDLPHEIMIYILSNMLYEVQLTDQILSPSPGNDDRMQSTTGDEKPDSGASEQERVQNARTQWKDAKTREKMHR